MRRRQRYVETQRYTSFHVVHHGNHLLTVVREMSRDGQRVHDTPIRDRALILKRGDFLMVLKGNLLLSTEELRAVIEQHQW